MKKKILTLVSLIFCLCLITINVSAISLSEKEDIYRADSFLYKNSIDKNVTVNWLLDDNNFIYPKQAKISNESFWESFLRNSLKNIDNATALASGNFSVLFENNEEYRKALKEIMLSFMETSDKNSDSINEVRQQERQEYYYGLITNAYSFCKASSDYSSLTTSITSQILEELCYKTRNEDFEVFENEFVMMFKTADEQAKARAMFDDYMDSAVFSNYLKGFTEFAGYTTEILNIAKYSSDVFVELKTYNRLDQEFIEFLRYLYTTSNSQDIIAVSGELLTKLTVSTETCKKNAITQIATKIASAGSDLISSKLIDLAFDQLGPVNVLSAVNLGVTAGNIVSDYWFSTSKTEEIVTSIFACDELSKVLSKSVSTKLSSYENYFGDYERQAKKAKELIYHTKLLWQTRYYGENLFYNFKITAYSADMSVFAYLFGDAAEDVEKIENWYEFQTSELTLAYNILFSDIDKSYYEDLYEYPEETEDFVIVDGKLIAYNGSSSSPCVPYDVHTIGTEAFNAEVLMTQLTIRGTTMETHSVANCGDLYSLYIPKSVTTIQNEAIYNCPNVTIYGYEDTIAETYAHNNNIPFYSLGFAAPNDGTYVNDYVLSEGTLNLDGQTMYVGGDFIHTGGNLKLGNGKLIIFGNYYITSADQSGYSSGMLHMENSAGHLLVYNDFVMDSTAWHGRDDELSAGTLEIKGDFVQKSTYQGSYGYEECNFRASGTHTVILSGTGEQQISFEDPTDSWFENLNIKNETGLVKINQLTVHESIIGNIISNYDINLNSMSVTLSNQKIEAPNIYWSDGGTIYLGDGAVLDSNLIQSSGHISIIGSSQITKNYYITSADQSGYSSGMLHMENSAGHLLVYNDFVMDSTAWHGRDDELSAGTLEIKGDFVQKSTYQGSYGYEECNFRGSGTHTVILSGTGEQQISFEDPTDSWFENLNIKNETGLVKINQLTVHESIIGNIISNYDINLNSMSVTLSNQKIEAPNIYWSDGGTIYLGDGAVLDSNLIQSSGHISIIGSSQITKNYYITSADQSGYSSGMLHMENSAGHLLVYNDFVMNSTAWHGKDDELSAGTLEIKGDFVQKSTYQGSYGNEECNFRASGTHTVILSGTGEQQISFEDPTDSWFNILVVKNFDNIHYLTAYRYNKLQIIYPFDFDVVEYNMETNQINVDVILSEDLQSLNGTVLISLYDENNKLIECRIKELSELEPQTFDGLYNYNGKYIVKAFYWSDMNSIKPLYSSIQKELTSK